SAYLFYGPGDHAGLHADLRKCELVLLAPLAGNLRPLVLHPSLVGATPADLMAAGVETGGAPEGGTPLPSPRSGATALRGRDLPHHRPQCRPDEKGVVVTLCYQAAF